MKSVSNYSRLIFIFTLIVNINISAQTSFDVIVGPGFTYTPNVLSINEGDAITFTSEGGFHDVNFNINSLTNMAFDNPADISSLPAQGTGFMGTITFDIPGTYNYDCSVGQHAVNGMVGQIIVNALPTIAQTVITDENISDAVFLWATDQTAAVSAYGNITNWDVGNVTDMAALFYDYQEFNDDISLWDVSAVIDMSNMFKNATSFNGDLSSWNVSSVTNMGEMFSEAESFNGDLSNWDVSNVGNMRGMFSDASNFNADISSWNTSNVIDMAYMFTGAINFNQDISGWDVSNVTYPNFQYMFDNVGLNNEIKCLVQTNWSANENWNIEYNWSEFCGAQTAVPTVVDIVINSENHNIVETAVIAADLVGTLSGDGPFTLFAPTDAAFAMIPENIMDSLLADPSGLLTQILLSHVTLGNVLSSDLSNGMIIPSLSTNSLNISITNGVVMINEATVTIADIQADNGVVHVIDAVIIPEINGCTDINAINFNPSANSDNGTCEYISECPYEISLLTMVEGDYDQEIGFAIVSSSGDVAFGISSGELSYDGFGSTSSLEGYPLYSPGTYYVCLDPNECYDFNFTDIYGDGWNGAYFTLNDDSFSLPSGGEINLKYGDMCPEEVCDYELISYEVSQDTTFGVSVIDFNSSETLYSVPAGSLGEFCLNPEGCYILQFSVGDGNLAGDSLGTISEYVILGDQEYSYADGEIIGGGAYNTIDSWTTTFSDIYDIGCILSGCTDPLSNNFNEMAIVNDGSCEQYPIGCTNPEAINYDSLAIAEDFTCVFDNQDFLIGTWEIDFWTQEGVDISDNVDGYFNFINENQLIVTTTDDLGDFQYINTLYQVIDNAIYIYPSDNETEPEYDTNYYQGHYGVFGEDSILWNPDMGWTCSGCNGQEILDADSIMGMSLQDIASLGQGLCFFNSSKFMSFESQEDCFSLIEETIWVNLELFSGDFVVLDYNLTNDQLSLTDDNDLFNLTFTDTYIGCLDPDAANFDEQSNQQLFDEFGNLSCIYESCDDTPIEGCIYSDGFGPFNLYFGPDECISYGGNPCGNYPNNDNDIYGCTNPSAYNYNDDANMDDESCIFDCSEVEIFENFENYVEGEYLANQSDGIWNTWSNNPGSPEDAYVSDSLSFSGSNSLLLEGGGSTDIILPLGDYQNGIWNLSFKMYVPQGFGAYFNLLHQYDINQDNNWAEEFYFSQSGLGYTPGGIQFNFAHDKWFDVIFNIDTQNDNVTCLIDNSSFNWTWSNGSNWSDISIGALNLFPAAPDGENAMYFIDDLRLTNNSCSELGCTQSWADNYDELAVVDDLSCFTWEQLVNDLQIQLDNYSNEILNLEDEIQNLSFELNEAYSQLTPCELQQEDIPLFLPSGWGMFGFTCPNPIDVTEAFSDIEDQVIIVKDAIGNVYIPEFQFDGIGALFYSRGYQIKTTEEILDFSFCPTITGIQEPLDMNYQVGDFANGGIIFYVDETGQHGLVAAPQDIPGLFEWGCPNLEIGVYDSNLGAGMSNTYDIDFMCDQPLIAASAALSFESEGFDDWYLPSLQELEEMYYTIGDGGNLNNIGGFDNSGGAPDYWSSTEFSPNQAFSIYFHDGNTLEYDKSSSFKVRAIRAF